MAAGATYEPIATITTSGSATNATFSSISGSYTDLIIIFSGTVSNSSYSFMVRFNGDTGSNYSFTNIEGNGTTAISNRLASTDKIYFSYNNVTIGSSTSSQIVNVMNYANTTTYKTAIGRVDTAVNSSGYAGTTAGVGLWRNTAAITSISLTVPVGNITNGSTFTLYGIAAAQTMANTFYKIASVTVGSGGASSIDFTSIPSTYTDLVIKVSARDARAVVASSIVLQINGSTAASGSYRRIYGDGSAAFSDSDVSQTVVQSGHSDGNSATANTFGNVEIYIPNYAGSANKSFSSDGVAETNATTTYMSLVAGLWANTAAITQITIKPATAVDFLQYSTATLYGIKSS